MARSSHSVAFLKHSASAAIAGIARILDGFGKDIELFGETLIALTNDNPDRNDPELATALMDCADALLKHGHSHLAIALADNAAYCVSSPEAKQDGRIAHRAFRMAKTIFNNGDTRDLKTAIAFLDGLVGIRSGSDGVIQAPSKHRIAALWENVAQETIRLDVEAVASAIEYALLSEHPELQKRALAVRSLLDGMKPKPEGKGADS